MQLVWHTLQTNVNNLISKEALHVFGRLCSVEPVANPLLNFNLSYLIAGTTNVGFFMERSKRMRSFVGMATLGAAVAGLIFFTALTSGAFSQSNDEIVQSAVSRNELKSSMYGMLVGSDFLKKNTSSTLVKKNNNNTKSLYCSLSKSQYGSIMELGGIKGGSVSADLRTVSYAIIDEQASNTKLEKALTAEKASITCIEVKDNKIFFISIPGASIS